LQHLARDGRFPVVGAELGSLAPILRVHPRGYLDALSRCAEAGGGILDVDTVLNRASWDAALGGVSAVLAAVRYAHRGEGHGFAAVRPPGHHALRERAMGFCLLANAVIAAREAQALGRHQVLIVDWDVHHGNGTQALIEGDPSIRLVSLHEWPAYPGTGREEERGVGNLFNVPRPPGLEPDRYVGDLVAAVDAATTGWQPDFVLVSAGYDSMRGDPLGGFTLEPFHYGSLIGAIRQRFPDWPIVCLLEGGYLPARVAEGVLATLHALI
jgi:acetoin utilization deacetylase AcuC-like enzyme